MRSLIKRLAESLLVGAGVDRAGRAAAGGRVLVLAYHNIIPAGESPVGDRSLHLPQAAFADQLEQLRATHDVIPLSAIDSPPAGSRPRAVITFDDAYRGALTVGLDELARRGLPATVFVAPGLFDTTTWWDRLADPVTGAVPGAVARDAFTMHAGSAARILAAFGAGSASLPAWAGIGSEADVRASATRPGVSLGAHSWSHANLAALGPDALTEELERPLGWLAGVGRGTIRWLAYPYGFSSPAVAQASAAAGYDGAFLIRGGWLPPHGAARHELPRLNVPAGLSSAGFRLRAARILAR